ncbi:protein of unknown function [Pseudomonas inefficax]|uniref:Uncharacterized protein n=1 Tax=Pseudomonas inefficax TaxID=2078786 RepID=A0AAQ1SSN6_9PSED|nr:protein of unknown function [Pseudomonas inefficax]
MLFCFAVVTSICQQRPAAQAFRGHARSHSYGAALKACDIPVGAGVPAKGPVQPSKILERLPASAFPMQICGLSRPARLQLKSPQDQGR